MYQPPKYQKKDPNYIFDFIQQHPFAIMVTQGEELLATHIPVLTEGTADNFRLFGHIARHNEQHRSLKNEQEALLIFQGAHAYVSSSWYTEKEISTWDYSAVHINVKLRIQTDEELENCLRKLVNHFMQMQDNPLYYQDLPNKLVQEHLPFITGFWCQVERIQAIAKLHQGNKTEDVTATIKHLQHKDDPLTQRLAEDIRREHEL